MISWDSRIDGRQSGVAWNGVTATQIFMTTSIGTKVSGTRTNEALQSYIFLVLLPVTGQNAETVRQTPHRNPWTVDVSHGHHLRSIA
jgi:hypothetical protein